jgi:hypothetical protein
VRLRPDSTTATSSRRSRDVSSLSRVCRILNSIAATSSNQTRDKLASNSRRLEFVCDLLETSPTNSRQVRQKFKTACLEEVAVMKFGIRQARDVSSLSRRSRCSGTWPLAASGAETGGRTPRSPGWHEGAARGRRKNYLFDRLRASSIEFLSHVKHENIS